MPSKNYIADYEKRIAEMRKRVRIDTAYIGAGLVLTLHKKGYDDDTIIDILNETNLTWTDLAETGVNPIKYCLEKTGFEVCPESEAKRINEYFEG